MMQKGKTTTTTTTKNGGVHSFQNWQFEETKLDATS